MFKTDPSLRQYLPSSQHLSPQKSPSLGASSTSSSVSDSLKFSGSSIFGSAMDDKQVKSEPGSGSSSSSYYHRLASTLHGGGSPSSNMGMGHGGHDSSSISGLPQLTPAPFSNLMTSSTSANDISNHHLGSAAVAATAAASIDNLHHQGYQSEEFKYPGTPTGAAAAAAHHAHLHHHSHHSASSYHHPVIGGQSAPSSSVGMAAAAAAASSSPSAHHHGYLSAAAAANFSYHPGLTEHSHAKLNLQAS